MRFEQHSSSGEDDTLVYAVSEMQGWRISMEDAHATILNLDGKTGDEKASFFAVYDGHGGKTVANFTGETLHKRLAETEAYKKGDYPAALKRAFLQTDEDFLGDDSWKHDPSGCTAVAALLVAGPKNDDPSAKAARQIIVANAGDSRCVLGVKGEAKALSHDHKPTDEREHSRILSAGGYVEMERVNGNLALSRAIGDFEYKQCSFLGPEHQIVTADPEIITHDINGEEEFLVLACDGIWDCMSNQTVVDFVRRGVAEGKELQTICEEMMEFCLAPHTESVGCDNMTVCIIALLGGRTKDEWRQWVKERVDNKIGWETPETLRSPFQYYYEMHPDKKPGSAGAGSGGGGGGRMDPRARLLGGLAGALGGAGIVFRPGTGTDDDGGITYEAYVSPDDSSDGGSETDEAGKTEKVQELEDEGKAEAERRGAEGEGEERPELQHQPEIVESPREVAKASESGSDAVKVAVKPSQEGSQADAMDEDKDKAADSSSA
ncbi:related to PTC3 - ser/thr protein phosphatase PP2C [Pseudozyma flocculosa]|uniref:protein-serine/threonine phosphatase n=1 Tax=Pseudozyma flocculosa TaxID=84751 RepID=A0A5C3FEA8_9BASI|nr:related to PTC3 - ser/thr protein phosphatase PP2C [Pseudozyma flocculosa]